MTAEIQQSHNQGKMNILEVVCWHLPFKIQTLPSVESVFKALTVNLGHQVKIQTSSYRLILIQNTAAAHTETKCGLEGEFIAQILIFFYATMWVCV